jgi:hypothetical protein
MPHVRRRTTKAGSVSTALVESYRDESGQPRQRLLANLYGEPDTVSALAKLQYRLEALQTERKDYEETSSEDDADFAALVFEAIDDKIADVEKQMSVIKKHCSATSDEIQAAMTAHKIALDDALAIARGSSDRSGCLLHGVEF